MITYLKLGAILALAALLFGAGYRFGGMAPKTELEALRAAQAEATAKAVLAERASAAVTLAHQNAVIARYENAPPDPIVATAAHRVYVYAAAASGCSVSGAHPVAGGAPEAPRVTLGPSRVEQALGDYIAKCDADARRLAAAQALAPH